MMVFVPGWMCPAWIWEKQIAHFQAMHHVVALDPRVRVNPISAASDLTPARRSRDIAELLDHLKLDRVVLVAWSMAVGEALGYVEQNRHEPASGVGVGRWFSGTGPDQEEEEGLLGRQAWLTGILTNRPVFMEGFFKMFFHEPPPAEWVARLRSDLDRTPARRRRRRCK